MKPNVFFIETKGDEEALQQQLLEFIQEKALLDFIDKEDFIAVKTHFGESKSTGWVRPPFFKKLNALIERKGARGFLTETSTLYRGNRSNAVDHLKHAESHGFSIQETGMPVVMADGLLGDEEVPVAIEGEMYDEVKVAAAFARVQGMVMISHFTGHIAAGFGATMKNLGMGCTSRKAKLIQHSTAIPSVKKKRCTGCGVCVQWCPATAISMNDDTIAVIDKEKCIGCGECLAVCRFDAVSYNWSTTYEDLQKKIAEHALGVHTLLEGKVLYINFLTRISKDCDCMTSYEKAADDIGVLISTDPVAIDAAGIDLVEERSGALFSELTKDIPYWTQVDHGEKMGLGSREYTLVKV